MAYPVVTTYGEIVLNLVSPHPPGTAGGALSQQAKIVTNNSGGTPAPGTSPPAGSGGTTGSTSVALPPTHIWSPPRGGGIIP